MNFGNILNQIGKVDPEVFEKTSGRRDIFKHFGTKVAVAALPMALGSMFKKAYGKSTSAIGDVLNFALTLEYLEARFYNTATLNASLFPTTAAFNAIKTIAGHETAHVSFLKTAISSMGETPVSEPTFDFTAGGTFPGVFSDYATFLAVAQAFEDTGVRAYKGQAGNLISSNAVLTAALQIHSVEARHASHIRQMRKANGFGDVKPWITGNNSGIASSAVQPIYNGEEVTTQAGVQIVNINGMSISSDAASEAFDEALSKDQVLAIVDPFIV
ncbi:ferritin-like domain-containing protein [Rurimicrobium arvi]|uniref:Ferritin-like domain-containing protein n=1 Tax=Rurimicrobium arvi TaxID=2049916 RepID=A0ABP8MWV7_9BACT